MKIWNLITTLLKYSCKIHIFSSKLRWNFQLAHYLDVAEVELIRQIGYRSDSFFVALSDLQNLHQEVRWIFLEISKCVKLTSWHLGRVGYGGRLEIYFLREHRFESCRCRFLLSFVTTSDTCQVDIILYDIIVQEHFLASVLSAQKMIYSEIKCQSDIWWRH